MVVKLLGPDGLPVRKELLEKELATPGLASVRNAWAGTVASGLTPERAGSLLRQAAEGDAHDYLVLAEEMEERDLHYAAVVGARKRAISSVDLVLKAPSESERHQEMTDAVREVVDSPSFFELKDYLVDGIAKGLSVVETVWRRGKMWFPHRYEHRDLRFFTFDKETGRKVLLLDDSKPEGIPLPPFKFIIHIPRLKTGLPIRGGLARLAIVGFLCKSYTIKDWMAFLEVFGMPLRLGRYGEAATKEDRQTLMRAVANLGTDAAAILPESMKIEFVEAVKNSGTGQGNIFKETADWWDRQLSKAVLGQTASTEGTPGKLGNEHAQENVRRDILRSDCRQLCLTLNRDIIKPFVDLNFGTQKKYPRLATPETKPEDIDALVNALHKLTPLGLKVEASEVRSKLGFAEPAEGAEILGEPASQTKALNRQGETDADVDEEDDIEREALADWVVDLGPIIDPVEQVIQESASAKEAIERLPEALQNMSPEDMIRSLTESAFKARALGDAKEE